MPVQLSYVNNQSLTNILFNPVVLNQLSFKQYFLLILLLSFITGCSRNSADYWYEFVPDTTPFIIVPDENTDISQLLSAGYIPVFDDISPSAIQLLNTFEEQAEGSLTIEAILLYTDTSNNWQPIWVLQSGPGFMERLTQEYHQPFEQNQYVFKDFTIEKLHVMDRTLFAAELSGWILLSESSLGIENSIRTLTNEDPSINLTEEQARPGSFIMNTESIDYWVQQFAQVMYRPALSGIFEGGNPVSLQLRNSDEDNPEWELNGQMEISDDASDLIRSISSEPEEFFLDRYIPLNAAAFSIQRLEPRMVPSNESEPQGETDEFLSENLSVWQEIAAQLDDEFAFASFAESGATSTSEYLFLRRINSASQLRSALNELVSEELVIRDGNTYFIQSSWLGKLLGSELNPMTDFYVSVFNDVAALSMRKGLAESIGGDAARRRVMYYDDDYMEVRNSGSEPLSSILYVDTGRFGNYIQPWLYPQNYFNTLISPLDLFVVTTVKNSDSSITFTASSFQRESEDQPYREQWVFPLRGGELTGEPILADIGGSNREEVIFSTSNRTVYALATDGTIVIETSTGDDDPVGTPVVYDWYGNNQNVIMQAAGNKVYAWNNNGNPLPSFPVTLNEEITTPLTITDVTRNGVAEIVVGTADRRLHILDARGQSISGWPQNTNAVLSNAPLISEISGQRSLFAFAENTLHAWEINGQRRQGYPLFLNSPMHGMPEKYNNHLLGAGRDGNLYSIGPDSLFSDSLSTTISEDSLYIQSLLISNSGLNATPSVSNLLLRNDDGFYRDDLILLQSDDGSIFLYNDSGELQFAQNLGQPASPVSPPRIIDLDNNQRMDVIALADFGRLYAWDLLNEQRLYDLPTTGMKYLKIADLMGDGNNEIIAQTREGLRCWTIYRTRTQSAGE